MLRAFKSFLAAPDDDLARTGYTAVDTDDEAAPHSSLHLEGDISGERHGRYVYLCFWALGAGVLLSWNALICTFPLLQSLFPAGATRTNLASYLSTVYCFANLFFLGLAQSAVGKKSPSNRLRWSLVLLLSISVLLTFPLLPWLLPLLSSSSSPFLLPILILITLVLAFSCSYLQSSVFALAALWGTDEILAVMSGQGGIAVLVSTVQVTLAVIDAVSSSAPDTEEAHSTLATVGLWAMGAAGTVGCLAAHQYLMDHAQYGNVLAPLLHRREEADADSKSRDTTLRVFRKNIRLELSVAFVFIVTLAIFPPITYTINSALKSVPRLLQPDVFLAVHFLLFNVGDYIGRTYLPALATAVKLSVPQIMFLSAVRIIFFPLFLFCNIPSRAAAGEFVFPDFVYFVILFSFGLSNGCVSSICMIYASSPSLNPAITEDQMDIAGTLAAFSLVSGLVIGSLCSFAVNYAINGNPFG